MSAWTTGWRGSTWRGEAALIQLDRRAPEQSAAEGAAESRLSGRTAPLARAQVPGCVIQEIWICLLQLSTLPFSDFSAARIHLIPDLVIYVF